MVKYVHIKAGLKDKLKVPECLKDKNSFEIKLFS